MAKGMDVGTMALLGGGGYLALAYHSGLWPFNSSDAPGPPTQPGGKPTCPTGQSLVNWPGPSATCLDSSKVPYGGGAPVTTQKPVDNTTPATPRVTPVAPVVQPCPTGYVRVNNWDPNAACINPNAPLPTFCDLKTPGWSMIQGVCRQDVKAVQKSISEQMITLAGTSVGLSTDQWCDYYTQATGNECPVDPGSIDMTVYNGAGVNLEDGTIGDRTTPISIETWLAIMQSQAPSLGLSGLGADFMTPSIPLLIAAGVAALMFMGRH